MNMEGNMFRHHMIGAIGLSLLLCGCVSDRVPPEWQKEGFQDHHVQLEWSNPEKKYGLGITDPKLAGLIIRNLRLDDCSAPEVSGDFAWGVSYVRNSVNRGEITVDDLSRLFSETAKDVRYAPNIERDYVLIVKEAKKIHAGMPPAQAYNKEMRHGMFSGRHYTCDTSPYSMDHEEPWPEIPPK